MKIPTSFLNFDAVFRDKTQCYDCGYFRRFYYRNSTSTAKEAPQDEVKDLLAKIGTLIVLPSDEQPVIATVNDPELLKGQPFFANAQKGDKVLIYNGARKAVLYNPILHKVVDVAPLSTTVPTAE